MKLLAHRAGLPGNVISFILCPFTPPIPLGRDRALSGHPFGLRGILILKTDPLLISLFTEISPWWSEIIFLAMESPNPDPVGLVLNMKSKILGRFSFDIPTPLSLMTTNTFFLDPRVRR
jgi:hypothetical protein